MSANNFEFLSREKFDEILDTYLNDLPENRRAKAIISQEMMDQAIQIFDDGNTNQDPKFKSWVRSKFTTMVIGNAKKLVEKSSAKPVYAKENLYDIIGSLHRILQHAGYKKSYAEVN